MTDACTLCNLPISGDPYTTDDVSGQFCCRGCLVVAQTVDEPAEISLEDNENEQTTAVPGDAVELFLGVDGMHCGTCEAFLESRADDCDGVYEAQASYGAEIIRVQYDEEMIDPGTIAAAISTAGYDATVLDGSLTTDQEPSEMPWRLLVGGFCGMMVMVWYVLFLYPSYFDLSPAEAAWSGSGVAGPVGLASMVHLWLLSTVVLVVTGAPILRGAYVSLRTGRPNMDLLVALAAVNAYVYSIALSVTGGEVYFDITVVVVLAVSLGNHYQNRIKRRAASAVSTLTEKRVTDARRQYEGADGLQTEVVGVDELSAGDRLVVKPGERVPVDGEVIEGMAAVDESLVTGESRPVRKQAGDTVVGGSILTDSPLVVSVTENAESTVDRLIRLFWEIQSTRGSGQRLADRLAGVFVPLVVVLAVGGTGWQLLSGTDVTAAVLTGLTVLVVSCPCALGLATPLAVAAGLRDGLDAGVVVTDQSVFETAPQTDVIAFDKTGTLTAGQMRLIDPGSEPARLRAAAVEQYASHPVADAITRHTSPPPVPVDGFERHPGRGVSAEVDGEQVVVGHPALFETFDWTIPDRLQESVDDARTDGQIPVLVGWNRRARDCLVVGDRLRPEWETVVSELASSHRVVVITGDDERAASELAAHTAIDELFASVSPEAKASILDRLDGTVTMVGDGTNDAPALAGADLGIALDTGGALATDAADAVVTPDDLGAVPAVFDVTAGTRRRIRQNLAWAFLYNTVAVPVAVAGYLNPLIAAVAMASSSLLVVTNSVRPIIDE